MNSLTTRYGRPGLTPLSEAVDQLFRDAFTWPRAVEAPAGPARLSLRSNVYETDEAYLVQTLLPGVKAEELNVTTDRNLLTIEGTAAIAAPEGARGIWIAFNGAEFREQVSLPGEVDAARASAEYRDGMLTLTLPKAEKARIKTIKVTGQSSSRPTIEQATSKSK
jgi:HSP20 family protein